MDIKQLIGLQIKNLRKSKGLTQEALAEQMDISPKYLSSIERGKENPTLDTLIKLFEALGLEVSEIFRNKHVQESAEGMRQSISELIKASDEEKLRLAAKIVQDIYL